MKSVFKECPAREEKDQDVWGVVAVAQSFSKTFKHEMGSLSYKLQEQGRKRLQEPLSLIETLLAVNEKESWSMWMCMHATHLKIFFLITR